MAAVLWSTQQGLRCMVIGRVSASSPISVTKHHQTKGNYRFWRSMFVTNRGKFSEKQQNAFFGGSIWGLSVKFKSLLTEI